jgi:sugar phosphate isomerase/epimerase
MNNTETTFLLGYVEQAVGGSQDPLDPPISISSNGSLAKWRDKMNFIDIRVNDPGLKNDSEAFETMLEKTQELGIEAILTLPEYIGSAYNVPPALNQTSSTKREDEKIRGKRKIYQRPEKIVHFRPCYLAIPNAFKGNPIYTQLKVEDCLPTIELGSKYGVKNIIVPVSQPGEFIDPLAETQFKKCLKEICDAAKKHEMNVLLRNGGISLPVFKKMAKEFGVKLAYNLGIALLEGDNIVEVYRQNSEAISVVMFQQLIQGLDKWNNRREEMEKALKDMLRAEKDYNKGLEEKDTHYAEQVLIRYNDAYYAYVDANRNNLYNLGLFQSGDLNVIPLLKEIRKDIQNGSIKYLLIETVPNTKNNDLIMRSVVPNNFTGSF